MKRSKRNFVKWALIILGIVFGMIIGPDGGSVGVTQSEGDQPNPKERHVFMVQGRLQAVPLPHDQRLQDSLRSRVLGTSLATTEGDMLWNQTYSGTGSAIPGPLGAFPFIQAADGGFVLAGRMEGDAWMVKTDFRGDIEWQQTYGGAGEEAAQVVIQTADNGFAIAGQTNSYGSGRQDFWLIKTDVHGEMEWNRTYDQGGFNDYLNTGIQTVDGGFVLAGLTASCDDGCLDAWLVKTDVYGNIEWSRTYGGDSGEGARAMIQTADGGFAFTGRTFSFGAGRDDFWLVKTDAHGKIEWQQTYGGADRDGPSAVIQTVDGGFVLAGYTADPRASDSASWLDDIWVVKTNTHGTVQWTQTYGGSGDDEAYAVIQTADGGFILAGRMGGDAWLAKTDFRGDIEWQQTYGGAGEEAAQAVIQTADGGFAFAGQKDGSAWLVKTISPDAPTVTILSPNGGEVWQDMQTITWTATDPQSDPLTYTVFYSSDGGQIWTQLATGLTDPSYLWNTTTVSDGTNYLIQVEANDGTHIGMDLSNRPFEIANEPTPTEPSEVARIVVSAEAWPIADRYWSPSASRFTLNTFDWLTEFSPGKRILKDSLSGIKPAHNNMVDTLQTNGYTIAIMDTTSWTPAVIASYDVVVIEEGPIDHTLLTEYVKGGGGVFLIGGHSGSDRYNEFLLPFGMSLLEPVYPVESPKQDTLTNFVSHPVTTGVTALELVNPTPIEVYSSDPQIIATFGDWNCLAVYSEELPTGAPTVTVVSPNGGESWQDVQLITWTATNPQADPLTYTIYYSPDGGQTWIRLATELTEPSYLWNTTTVVNGVECLIRVMASNGMYTGVDVSDTPFEIANASTNTPPTVQVLRPNGGERVRGTFEIQWSANDPEGDGLTFTISYSPNEGQTWIQLASEVAELSYVWDTTGVQVGTTHLVKVEASDGVYMAEDSSDALFTVEPETPTEKSSDGFFVPSFRMVEALGALLVLLGLGKRIRRWDV